MRLTPGDSFGRYRILSVLGVGGMGRVLAAEDTLLERRVALKLVLRLDPEARARFFREARIAAKLTHPNTVRLYDVGEIDDVPFLVMELIEGTSLVPYVGDVRIPLDRKIRWLVGAARGLATAHEQGLIHRDVKPGNIMVAKDDTVKVVDFGLAKQVEADATANAKAAFLTAPAHIVGTVSFMAPEQIAGASLDGRADQFSWAVTAHVLLASQLPRARVPGNAPGVATRVPREIAAVLERSLRFHREERFASMNEAADHLEAAMRMVGQGARRDEAQTVAAPALPARTQTLKVEQKTAIDPPRDLAPVVRQSGKPEPGWRIKRQSAPCSIAPIRGATISADGRVAIAVGARGLARLVLTAPTQQGWEPWPLPAWLDPAEPRCIAFTPDTRSVVIGGAHGLVVRLWIEEGGAGGSPGRLEPVGAIDRFPVLDRSGPNITFHAMAVHPDDVHLVGSVEDGDTKRGVLHRVTLREPLYPTTIVHEHPLYAVTRLARAAVACGADGWVGVLLETGELRWLRPVVDDLYAVTELGGDIHVVGRGAAARLHAPDLTRITIEPVATSTTLRLIFVKGEAMWASTDGGRILRREVGTAGWKVMHAEPAPIAFVALHVDDQRLVAIARDGSVAHGEPWVSPQPA